MRTCWWGGGSCWRLPTLDNGRGNSESTTGKILTIHNFSRIPHLKRLNNQNSCIVLFELGCNQRTDKNVLRDILYACAHKTSACLTFKALTFKSGGVVLDTSQVQVVIPPLCVLVHAVMLTLRGRRWLGALPLAAMNE